VRLCVVLLFILSAVLLGITANELRLFRDSQSDVAASQQILATLYNETSGANKHQIIIPYPLWIEMNQQLYNVSDRWTTQIASVVAGISLICVCFVFEVIIFLLPPRPLSQSKKGGEPVREHSGLLSSNHTHRSFSRANSPAPVHGDNANKKSSAMMCEGPLYEPWNQATLDKLSGEDAPAVIKITRAIYRYGPIAGKILLRRFGHLLTNPEIMEIERILNFGQG